MSKYDENTCPKSDSWLASGGRCGWAWECDDCLVMERRNKIAMRYEKQGKEKTAEVPSNKCGVCGRELSPHDTQCVAGEGIYFCVGCAGSSKMKLCTCPEPRRWEKSYEGNWKCLLCGHTIDPLRDKESRCSRRC